MTIQIVLQSDVLQSTDNYLSVFLDPFKHIVTLLFSLEPFISLTLLS